MEHQSASNSPSSTKKQLLLEQKVAHSEQHILELKTRRNLLAPISKLSSETLLRIFDLLKDDEYSPFNDHLGRPFLTKHIIVHVCRQWRFLAFSAPAFWSKPPLWDHDWALRYLKLSKLEPLDVKIRADIKTPLCTTVLKEMPRIKVLSIIGYLDAFTEIQKLLQSNKSLDAPLLTSLKLHFRVEMRGKPSPFKLLDDTFRQAGALRQLELRNITVKWDSPLFRQQLTTLKLNETPASARPTWKQLMDTLRGIPSLVTLTLSQACPRDEKVNVKEIVHLPNLRDLIIDCDTPDQIRTFLSQVTFPQLQVIGGGCFALSPDTKDYMGVLDPLLKLLPADAKVEDAVTSMKLSDSLGPDRLYIRLENAALSTFPILNLHLPPIKKYDNKSSVASIIQSLKLSNLIFVGFYARPFDMLKERFWNQQNIVTIEIGYATELPHLTDVLSIPIDHSPNALVPFPNLKTIGLTEIHGLPWLEKSDVMDNEENKDDKDDSDQDNSDNEERENDEDNEGNKKKDDDDDEEEFDEDWEYRDPWELKPKGTWTNFRRCLIRRSQCGVPVQELFVHNCTGLTMNWFTFFQEVVPVVNWDKNRVR